MKKHLLSLLFVAVAGLGAMAVAPTYKWAKLPTTGTAQDNIYHITKLTDGNLAVMVSGASSSKQTDYDGTLIGIPDSDRNACVVKLNPENGDLIWHVDASGYNDLGYADLAATSDGGMVVLFRTRNATTANTNAPYFTDAYNNTVTLDEWNLSLRIYQQVLVKISANGAIEWAKVIVMDQSPLPTKTAETSDGVNSSTIVVDDDDNIYVSGYFTRPMILTGEKNSCHVLTPRNVNTTTQSGSLYVIKLDSEANYLGCVSTEGEISSESQTKIMYDNGTLYLVALVKGSVDNELTLGGKTVTLENALSGVVAGAFNASDLSGKWLTYIRGEVYSTSVTFQFKALDIIGSQLVAMGCLNGKLYRAGESEAFVESNASQLQSFFIRFDPSQGTVVDGGCNNIGIGSYYGGYELDDVTYFFGYQMSGTNNGTFLDEWDLSGDTPQYSALNQILTGAMGTAWDVLYDAETSNVYMMSRTNAINHVYTGAESNLSNTAAVYATSISCYTYAKEDTSTGVDIVEAAETFGVKGVEGAVEVTAAATVEVNVTNTLGQIVAAQTVNAGVTNIALPAGIYLVNDNKVIVK